MHSNTNLSQITEGGECLKCSGSYSTMVDGRIGPLTVSGSPASSIASGHCLVP